MIKVVYALITISCSGHTNANCVPTVEYFPTRAQCETARYFPEHPGFWSGTVVPATLNTQTICLGTVE